MCIRDRCKWWPLWAQTVTGGIAYELVRRLFHIGNFCFSAPFFKQMLLKNCAVDFIEICNVCTRKVIIKAAKRIFNSDKICCSYYDFYFGVTFLEHTVAGRLFCGHYRSICNHRDVIGVQSIKFDEITQTPFKVIQCHRCRYQSKLESPYVTSYYD